MKNWLKFLLLLILFAFIFLVVLPILILQVALKVGTYTYMQHSKSTINKFFADVQAFASNKDVISNCFCSFTSNYTETGHSIRLKVLMKPNVQKNEFDRFKRQIGEKGYFQTFMTDFVDDPIGFQLISIPHSKFTKETVIPKQHTFVNLATLIFKESIFSKVDKMINFLLGNKPFTVLKPNVFILNYDTEYFTIYEVETDIGNRLLKLGRELRVKATPSEAATIYSNIAMTIICNCDPPSLVNNLFVFR
ncbi:hypothetical protein THOM_1252 [Trachipleistophora hominis]|uniref:Uncharacterized protein n=1 Tax=Trachipleistophora hominis TaxID=72359 RepID=L7JXL5_TRAHO|nr:hypothetical protein THOM_1252 [Trachipleistophora hominis]